MKILYGIQGTGNGHLSRARIMQRYLKSRSVDVTYLFSGRSRENYFEMEAFGNFEVNHGLTFAVNNGQVNYLKTMLKNNLLTFIKEVNNLNLDSYDLVLCDFEPVSAWASKLQNKPIISFGNQSAYRYNIPITGGDLFAQMVMRYFAPANINIGLHWHHFDQPILPPIIDVNERCDVMVDNNKILVYLPFDDPAGFYPLFSQFREYEFYIYHPDIREKMDSGNLHKYPLSVQQFQQDLKTSAAVICNAGFALPSECIHFGKKLLVKPVKNQMEQESNALTLTQLGLAESMSTLDAGVIKRWIESPYSFRQQKYPDVAKTLVDWIIAGNWQDFSDMQRELWASVT